MDSTASQWNWANKKREKTHPHTYAHRQTYSISIRIYVKMLTSIGDWKTSRTIFRYVRLTSNSMRSFTLIRIYTLYKRKSICDLSTTRRYYYTNSNTLFSQQLNPSMELHLQTVLHGFIEILLLFSTKSEPIIMKQRRNATDYEFMAKNSDFNRINIDWIINT